MLVLAGVHALAAIPAAAADQSLLARCWPATTLAAAPGERKPHRRDAGRDPQFPPQTFPAPPLSRTPCAESSAV